MRCIKGLYPLESKQIMTEEEFEEKTDAGNSLYDLFWNSCLYRGIPQYLHFWHKHSRVERVCIYTVCQ